MTKQLKQHLDRLLNRFETEKAPTSFSDKPFFINMKKETASLHDLLENWESRALKLIKDRTINVHPHQIVSTKENIEMIILHSYYFDVRRRRYMELQQSSHYICDLILKEL